MVAASLMGWGMALFNHEVRCFRQPCVEDSTVEVVHVELSYDNVFGERCFKEFLFDDSVHDVKVGGTATSSTTVHQGIIKHIDLSKNQLTAETPHEQLVCVFDTDERLQVNQDVIIVDHLDHGGDSLVEFNWLATRKKIEALNLNSVKLILLDEQNDELGCVNIDPYLGCVNNYGGY